MRKHIANLLRATAQRVDPILRTPPMTDRAVAELSERISSEIGQRMRLATPRVDGTARR